MEINMKKIIITTLTVLPLLLAAPVWADEISDQIKTGLKAYEDKDYKTAVEELKFVTAQLTELKSKEDHKLLPKALDGWTTKAIDSSNNQRAMAMLGGGAMMKSRYERNKESIEIEIVANSPMIAAMTVMMNPMMLAGNKTTKPYRYNKAKGIIKKDRKITEITLVIAGQIMLKLTGKNLEDDAILKQYLETIDMKKLKETLL
jgi:hypothetical protein